MSYRYFAYGSTLDAESFAAWAREHGYPGLALADGIPAVLDDHELVLNVPSRYWMGAVGTIEPRSGASVYGVLFELPDEDADKIRHREGVATGLFHEIEVEVRLWAPDADATTTLQLARASAFRAAEGRSAPGAPVPSSRWLDAVVNGARQHGLPDLWIAELRRRGRR